MKEFKVDFIVVILTILMTGYLMYSRVAFYKDKIKRGDAYVRESEKITTVPKSLPTLKSEDDPNKIKQTSPVASTETRNILFRHRSSASVKKVSIVGDFNDWSPQEMKKDSSGIWSITVPIAPGYYAYNFIVDGRPQKDFNNPKTFDTGRGFMSSYLEVKPKN